MRRDQYHGCGNRDKARNRSNTWLVVVARRVCVDHIRARSGRLRDADSPEERERRSRRKRLEDLTSDSDDVSIIVDEAPAADEGICGAEISSELAAALSCLDPRDRLLLALRFDDGLSVAEIAIILRFPSQFHVYRKINTLLSILRVHLRWRGIETAAS